MTEIHVNLAEEGIVIKADTIGALEALCKELEGKEIGVMRAEVGAVSRLDLIETETIKNPMYRVLLSFNTPILPDAAEMIKNPLYTQVKVFDGRVIYQLIDQYVEWRDEQKRLQEKQRFEHVVMPAKIRLLPDCVFRQSNPAVVGVRVLGGKLRSGVGLIKTRWQKGRTPQDHAAHGRKRYGRPTPVSKLQSRSRAPQSAVRSVSAMTCSWTSRSAMSKCSEKGDAFYPERE